MSEEEFERGVADETTPYTDEVSRKLWTEDADGNPRKDPPRSTPDGDG